MLGYHCVNVTHLWPEYCENAKKKPHLLLLSLLRRLRLLLRLLHAASAVAAAQFIIAAHCASTVETRKQLTLSRSLLLFLLRPFAALLL